MKKSHIVLVPSDNFKALTEPIVVRLMMEYCVDINLLCAGMSWILKQAITDIFLCQVRDINPPDRIFHVIYDKIKNSLYSQVSSVIDFTIFMTYEDVFIEVVYDRVTTKLTIYE